MQSATASNQYWARNKSGKRVQPVPPMYDPDVGARATLFAPQEPFHRTRGRFTGRSRDSALALTSTQVSTLLLVTGGVLAMVLSMI